MHLLKIFVTADIHLGMKYASYEEVREELSQARQETLARCVRRANEEECDLFVVAGDLFERTNVSRDTVLSAVDALSNLKGKPCWFCPGTTIFSWESILDRGAIFTGSPSFTVTG